MTLVPAQFPLLFHFFLLKEGGVGGAPWGGDGTAGPGKGEGRVVCPRKGNLGEGVGDRSSVKNSSTE